MWRILIICAFVIELIDCKGWIIEEEETCMTPDDIAGNCMVIKKCASIINIIRATKNPFPEYIADGLKKYKCGVDGNDVKVCCPGQPIVIKNPNAVEPPSLPFPPDVTNHRNYNLLPEDCGMSKFYDEKIIFDKDKNLLRFPWMALIAYNTKQGPELKCAGTIINDKYILTAAGCLTKEPVLNVRIGENDIKTNVDCQAQVNGSLKCTVPVQDLTIEEIIVHPDFNSSILSNDIGLLRVEKINLTAENAKPICLPAQDSTRNIKFNNTILSGWGNLDDCCTPSHILLREDLPFVNQDNCRESYSGDPAVRITEKHICAGGHLKINSCTGDKGGPVIHPVYSADDIRFFQRGILSFGPKQCDLEGYPMVFTNIAYYMDWILDNMKP